MIPPPHTEPTPQQRRHYLCYRAGSPLTLNGRLDKPFWQSAPWTEDFVDIEGDTKPRPPFRTRAKLLWDDEHLYIGAELEEPHVWATLTQRDSIVYHDNDFEVFLSPTGDNHNYYELEINALNTIFDLFLPKPYRDGGQADHDWDVKGLRSAVHIDGTLNDPTDRDRGWSVELAFPWKAFDRHGAIVCPPKHAQHWRINFSRVQWDLEVHAGQYKKVTARDEHNWVWSPQGLIDMHRPEQWGTIQFSTKPPGTDAFNPDPSTPARDALHRIYYAQAALFARTKRWATTLQELAAHDARLLHVHSPCIGPPTIERTPQGWIAHQRLATSNATAQRWSIAHDSRIARTDLP